MAGGKCKRRFIKFGKTAARFLGPALLPIIPQVVQVLELIPSIATGGHEKRRVVIDAVKNHAKAIGHDAYDAGKDALTSAAEGYVRASIEPALANLRSGVTMQELADWADEDGDDLPDEDPS
jgi:hypothetical protein